MDTANNQKKVIILNKPFLGGWLNKDGNIGHEIIDFLLTDSSEHYAYNNPWGVCPDDVWVEGTKDLERTNKEKYVAKYLVLTSEERGKDFDILYVLELSEKLHRLHTVKNANEQDEFLRRQNEVKKIIRKREIKYNDKYLDEIYGNNDSSLYLTFKCSKLYKAKMPILVTGMEYNFQRNKGYVRNDEFKNDYNLLIDLIEKSINNKELEEITPSVLTSPIFKNTKTKTFLDLTRNQEDEQTFTYILSSLLNEGKLFNEFCEQFKRNKTFININYNIYCENKIVKGRMDVCGESAKQRVIIENKINSGLNGKNPEDNTSQLSTYYVWGKENGEPLCFIVAPNYKLNEIDREINKYDPKMKDVYIKVSYGKIAKFIDDNKNKIPTDYSYYNHIDEFIVAFNKLSYNTKEELYASMFYEATIN